MPKKEFEPVATKSVSFGTREIDLPLGWYKFSFETDTPPAVFDYVIGRVWDKATEPPEPAARVLFTPEAAFCIEYRCFSPNFSLEDIVCMTRHVRITRAFRLNTTDLRSVMKWQKEASRVIRENFRQFLSALSRKKNDSVDKNALFARVEELLNAAPDRTLLNAHTEWLFESLPNTIHRIYLESRYFLSLLFDNYKAMGGLEDQRSFQVIMGLLLHLYKPAVTASKLSRPDGTNWRSEREILNCWEGMTLTRKDAWRYLKIMQPQLL
jgi:hypothetical protein